MIEPLRGSNSGYSVDRTRLLSDRLWPLASGKFVCGPQLRAAPGRLDRMGRVARRHSERLALHALSFPLCVQHHNLGALRRFRERAAPLHRQVAVMLQPRKPSLNLAGNQLVEESGSHLSLCESGHLGESARRKCRSWGQTVWFIGVFDEAVNRGSGNRRPSDGSVDPSSAMLVP